MKIFRLYKLHVSTVTGAIVLIGAGVNRLLPFFPLIVKLASVSLGARVKFQSGVQPCSPVR